MGEAPIRMASIDIVSLILRSVSRRFRYLKRGKELKAAAS